MVSSGEFLDIVDVSNFEVGNHTTEDGQRIAIQYFRIRHLGSIYARCKGYTPTTACTHAAVAAAADADADSDRADAHTNPTNS